MERFNATQTKVSCEGGLARTVRLLGQAPGGSEMITLQRATDPQDDVPGLAGVYVERGEQQFAAYAAVERCELWNNALRLLLNPDGSLALGGIDEWVFQLVKTAELQDALEFIFKDCDCFEVMDEELA